MALTPAGAWAQSDAASGSPAGTSSPGVRERTVTRGSAPGLELQWMAPAECPSAGDVVAQVAWPEGPPPNPSLRVLGVVTERDVGWELELQTEEGGSAGSRLLSALQCEDLGRSAALVLTLALARSARAAEERRQTAPNEPPPSSPSPPATARPSPRRTPAEGAPKAEPPNPPVAPSPWGVALALVGDSGTLPRASVGSALAVEWGRRDWRLSLTGTWLWSGASEDSSLEGVRADFEAGDGELAGSWMPRLGPLRLGLSLGVRAARISGEARGLEGGSAATAWVPMAGLAGRVRWPAEGPWAMLLGVELAQPLQGARFEIEGLGQLHRVGEPTLRGTLGLGCSVGP